MDSFTQLFIGELEVANEIIVLVRLLGVMFCMEVFAAVISVLGGFRK